jgi:hypothetical protein
MIKNILAAAAFGVAAMGAHASANLLTDGNFESTGESFSSSSSYCYGSAVGARTCGSAPAYAVNGWSGTGDVVYLSSDSNAWQYPDSQSHAGIDLGDVVAGVQNVSTLTSDFVFTKGQEYLLTWVSTNRGYGDDQSYSVQAGGVVDPKTITTSANGWNTYSFEFVAANTGPLTFTGLSTSGDHTSFIDNVQLSAVPEPTSLLMMAFGTLGLLAWRRRAQV